MWPGWAVSSVEESPNGNPSDATIAGGLAHEHSESVTDPEINAWFDSKGEEVADKCRTLVQSSRIRSEPLGKAPDGANYNQVVDGDLYWYQQEWSNEDGRLRPAPGSAPRHQEGLPENREGGRGHEGHDHRERLHRRRDGQLREAAATEAVVSSSTSLTATLRPAPPERSTSWSRPARAPAP